jgi:hypothetical protein
MFSENAIFKLFAFATATSEAKIWSWEHKPPEDPISFKVI